MMNKDYILRIAERLGRAMAIILHLRKSNKQEEALIYIDDLFLQTTGFSASFVDSASEEMLLQMVAPLGNLNVQKCVWMALLLKEEGDIYVEMGKEDESYYRYLKSLHFFLEVAKHGDEARDIDVPSAVEYDLSALEAFELPQKTKIKLFSYFDALGQYSRARDMLYEVVNETEGDVDPDLIEQGKAFFERLRGRSDEDLRVVGLSRKEIGEGLELLGEEE
jgi:Family of unknown function (DUF6483)